MEEELDSDEEMAGLYFFVLHLSFQLLTLVSITVYPCVRLDRDTKNFLYPVNISANAVFRYLNSSLSVALFIFKVNEKKI